MGSLYLLLLWYICKTKAFWPLTSAFDLWPWTKVKGHGTKLKAIYDILYVYNTNEVFISHSLQDICENSISDLWPWPKVKGHGTKWKPIYDFLYGYNTNEVSIFHSLWDICENRFSFGAMTFDLCPRSKVMAPNESPYMISYMSTIQMESPAHMVTEILRSFEKCIQKCYRRTDWPTGADIELLRQLKTA